MPEFITGMTPHIDIEHKAIEPPDPQNMGGDEKGDNKPEESLTHGLYWMKRQGGKRSRWLRAMMNHVVFFEPLHFMHPAVSPIEVCVVGQLNQHKINQKIKDTSLIPLCIDLRPAGLKHEPQDHPV